MGNIGDPGGYSEDEVESVSKRGKALGERRCDLCGRYAIHSVGNVVLCGLHYSQLESKPGTSENQ